MKLRAIFHRALFGLFPAIALVGVQTVHADTLDSIKKRGKLIVGVKADVPLWGVRDKISGKIVGLEPDLAADLARQLKVRLELVPVLSSERIQALESRRVDVLIATVADTPERRDQMTMVLPHYYASGYNLLARKSERFRSWTEVRNRRVCSRRDSFFNRLFTVEYGVDIVPLFSADHALEALADGRCAGFVYGDTAIMALLQESRWADYEMPFKSLFPTQWAVAVHREERGGRLEAAVSQQIVGWYKNGMIGRLEQKWGIARSSFVMRMEALWGAKHACGDSVSEKTPAECL